MNFPTVPTSNPSFIKHHSLPLIILCAITLVTFWPSLAHDFVTDWDDQFYVTLNPVVWSLSFHNIELAFTKYFVGNYAPLHIISYMFDSSIWGLRPSGFIFTNVVIHLFNGIFYYLLVWKLTFKRLWSLVSAGIFLLHPVQVESVVWVSQRKNVLAMLFFLIAIHFYVMYRSETQNNRNGVYLFSVLSFFAAVLTKSVVVILPLLLVAYDHCFLGWTDRKKWIVNKIPYLFISLSIGILAIKSQSPEIDGGISTGWHGGSPLTTFYTMLLVIVRYARLLFWPSDLCAFYGFQPSVSFDLPVFGAAIFVLSLIGLSIFVARKNRKLFFWIVCAFLGILPVLQIIPLVTFMNDRYLYFPMLGLAALVGACVESFYSTTSTPMIRSVFSCILLLCFSILSISSIERAKVWQNSYTLWSDARVKFPNHPLPCFGLGSIHLQRGELETARNYFLQAYQLGMKTKLVVLNLGRVYLSLGDLEQAKLYATALVSKYPDFSLGLMLLGDYCRQAGDQIGATDAYRRAVATQGGMR